MVLSSNEKYTKRIDICKQCDQRRELPMNVLQCKKCGCIMNLKARLDGMKCPIGKW
jgi:hypothetical protein